MASKANPGLSAKIEALREAIGHLKVEDPKLTNQFYLAHWLRGNKMDVSKTVKAIEANRKWRRDSNIDSLENQELDSKFKELFPIVFDAKTNSGRPVVFVHAGDLEVPKFNAAFGKEQLMRHLAQVMVKMERIVFNWDNEWSGSIEELPTERASGYYVIVDALNISIKSAMTLQALNFYLEWTKCLVNNFPSISRTVLTINAPTILTIPGKMVKPVFASKGYDLVLLGTNASEEDLKREVYSVITNDQLNEFQAISKTMRERWSEK